MARLARAGHYVVATTRSAERAQLIRDAGAEPVVVDALDADAFWRAIALSMDGIALFNPASVISHPPPLPR